MAGTMAGIGECEYWETRLNELEQAEATIKDAKEKARPRRGKK